jgi:hypothetical protein
MNMMKMIGTVSLCRLTPEPVMIGFCLAGARLVFFGAHLLPFLRIRILYYAPLEWCALIKMVKMIKMIKMIM